MSPVSNTSAAEAHLRVIQLLTRQPAEVVRQPAELVTAPSGSVFWCKKRSKRSSPKSPFFVSDCKWDAQASKFAGFRWKAGSRRPLCSVFCFRAASIAAALLSYYTTQVDGLLAGKLGVAEAASALQIAVRFPDDGGADEVVAAIGEQILGHGRVAVKLDGSLQQRLQRGPGHTHRGAGAVSVDGYTLTLAVNPWNIVRTYNLTPGRELLFACRYRLGTASNFMVYMSEADNVYDPLYGSFVGDQGAWSTAKMYFTVPPNGVCDADTAASASEGTMQASNAVCHGRRTESGAPPPPSSATA